LRTIVENCEAFSGEPILNHPLLGQNYDATLVKGRVLIGPDGEPGVLVWINVNDVFVHGPTHEKLIGSLKYLTDTEVLLGLICQSVNTSPSFQIQKFCGFLYDSKEAPCLRVPQDKLSRYESRIRYVLVGVKWRLAELTLAVVVDTLQSLVPATPGVIGDSFLDHVYRAIIRTPSSAPPGTAAFYH
jgi:hypothetical protein